MFELSNGELFVVCFVTIAVVSALWWPRLGATIGEFIANGRAERKQPRARGGEPRNRPSDRGPSGESSRG